MSMPDDGASKRLLKILCIAELQKSTKPKG
jgi:hypothetical protein